MLKNSMQSLPIWMINCIDGSSDWFVYVNTLTKTCLFDKSFMKQILFFAASPNIPILPYLTNVL